jgi:hypothetical protein
MIRFEYKKETLLESSIEARLNALGDKGWELILLTPIAIRMSLGAYFTGYFKRIKDS